MGMSEQRIRDIVLSTMKAWLPGQVEALERRVTTLEGEVATRNGPGGLGHIGEEIVDAIDGQNLRRAQLAERRLKEAEKEINHLRTQVWNLREAATVVSSWIEFEKFEKVKRDLETMTDYATKLKTERDIARRRADDLVQSVRDLTSDVGDRRERNAYDADMTSDMYARGRRDVFVWVERKLKGLVE